MPHRAGASATSDSAALAGEIYVSFLGHLRMKISTPLMCLALGALLTACNENHYVAPPPPKVTVAPPVKQEITRYLEATGILAAWNSANLVARVTGFLQKIK